MDIQLEDLNNGALCVVLQGRLDTVGVDRIDANVTTLITAAVLFFLGAGPVRGFAVTLAIGIITSVFTAINVTRLIVEVWYNWRKPKTLVV